MFSTAVLAVLFAHDIRNSRYISIERAVLYGPFAISFTDLLEVGTLFCFAHGFRESLRIGDVDDVTEGTIEIVRDPA